MHHLASRRLALAVGVLMGAGFAGSAGAGEQSDRLQGFSGSNSNVLGFSGSNVLGFSGSNVEQGFSVSMGKSVIPHPLPLRERHHE